MISSVMGTGVYGIQRGNDMLNRSADQIAKASIPPEEGGTDDLAKPIVEQQMGKNQFQASAKVVQAGSNMLGTLIDLKV